MPEKIIMLPYAESGYYKLGDLPELIAEAQYPIAEAPTDYLLRVVIWRDDGTEAGQYFECFPPEGAQLEGYDRVEEWTERPIVLTPREIEDHASFRFANLRWHWQRQPVELRPYWPDGSLVVQADHHQIGTRYHLQRMAELESYTQRLESAAGLPFGDPGQLPLIDSNQNPITYRVGAVLRNGLVHIDWLNQWGAIQTPPNMFETRKPESVTAAESEGGAGEQLEGVTPEFEGGWYDATLDAAFWFSRRNVSPDEAALLLVEMDPHATTVEEAFECESSETTAQDFKRLLRAFREVEESHDLKGWISVAKEQRLKHHSWVRQYADRLAPETDQDPPAEQSSALNVKEFATVQRLIEVFGTYTNLEEGWFRRLDDVPGLKAARVREGGRGRNALPPLFDPYKVMLWLMDPSVKKQGRRPLRAHTGWRLLKERFELAYQRVEALDPTKDDF